MSGGEEIGPLFVGEPEGLSQGQESLAARLPNDTSFEVREAAQAEVRSFRQLSLSQSTSATNLAHEVPKELTRCSL
jgi:hypothetical protein